MKPITQSDVDDLAQCVAFRLGGNFELLKSLMKILIKDDSDAFFYIEKIIFWSHKIKEDDTESNRRMLTFWTESFDKHCDQYKKKLPSWTVYGILGRTVIGE